MTLNIVKLFLFEIKIIFNSKIIKNYQIIKIFKNNTIVTRFNHIDLF